jgi:hypothetical protein
MRAWDFIYEESIMLVDGSWALEIAERLKVEMETAYARDDDLRSPDEWITVMQEELEAIKYLLRHKAEAGPVYEEDDDAD